MKATTGWQSSSTNPAGIVQAALMRDIARAGHASRFQKVGFGTFALVDALPRLKHPLKQRPAGKAARARTSVREESAYYPWFADWLGKHRNVDAFPLGDNRLGGVFGTPDVIGYVKPVSTSSSSLRAPHQWIDIVAAEVKCDDNNSFTALGQALSYSMFARFVYIVIPETASNLPRIHGICERLGFGLVTISTFIHLPGEKADRFDLRVEPRPTDATATDMKAFAKRLRKNQPSIAEAFSGTRARSSRNTQR